MALNNEQEKLLKGYIRGLLNQIESDYDYKETEFNYVEISRRQDAEKLQILRLILKKELTQDDVNFLVERDMYSVVRQIRDIILHPCPQNMSKNSLINNGDFKSIPVEVLDREDLMQYNYDGIKLKVERKGILGLTAKNDNYTSHVTKGDVVSFIRYEVHNRVIGLSANLDQDGGEKKRSEINKVIKESFFVGDKVIQNIFLGNLEGVHNLTKGNEEKCIEPIDLKTLRKIGEYNHLSLKAMINHSDDLKEYMKPDMGKGARLKDIIKIAKYDHNALEKILSRKCEFDKIRNGTRLAFSELSKIALSKNDLLDIFLDHSKEVNSLLKVDKQTRRPAVKLKDLVKLGEKNSENLKLILEDTDSVNWYLSHGVSFEKIKEVSEKKPGSFKRLLWEADSIKYLSDENNVPPDSIIKLALKNSNKFDEFLDCPGSRKSQKWVRENNNNTPSTRFDRVIEALPFNRGYHRQR